MKSDVMKSGFLVLFFVAAFSCLIACSDYISDFKNDYGEVSSSGSLLSSSSENLENPDIKGSDIVNKDYSSSGVSIEILNDVQSSTSSSSVNQFVEYSSSVNQFVVSSSSMNLLSESSSSMETVSISSSSINQSSVSSSSMDIPLNVQSSEDKKVPVEKKSCPLSEDATVLYDELSKESELSAVSVNGARYYYRMAVAFDLSSVKSLCVEYSPLKNNNNSNTYPLDYGLIDLTMSNGYLSYIWHYQEDVVLNEEGVSEIPLTDKPCVEKDRECNREALTSISFSAVGLKKIVAYGNFKSFSCYDVDLKNNRILDMFCGGGRFFTEQTYLFKASDLESPSWKFSDGEWNCETCSDIVNIFNISRKPYENGKYFYYDESVKALTFVDDVYTNVIKEHDLVFTLDYDIDFSEQDGLCFDVESSGEYQVLLRNSSGEEIGYSNPVTAHLNYNRKCLDWGSFFSAERKFVEKNSIKNLQYIYIRLVEDGENQFMSVKGITWF